MYTRNEKRTGPIRSPLPFFRPSFVPAIGSAAGLTAVLYTTGILAANACLPVLAGMMIGLVPTVMVNTHLFNEFNSRQIFLRQPLTDTIFNFLLRAATYTLGLLISLAVASMMVSLTMNPFTTPALIAGGVSAAIIISMYLFLSYKAGQSLNDAKREMVMMNPTTNVRSENPPAWLSSGVDASRSEIGTAQKDDEGKYASVGGIRLG